MSSFQLTSGLRCGHCTLENATSTEVCAMCEYSRPRFLSDEGVVEFQPKPGGSLFISGRELRWSCPRCSWQNDERFSLCKACGFKALNVVEVETVQQPLWSSDYEPETDCITRSVGTFLKKKFVPSKESPQTDKKKATKVANNGWKCPHCTFVNHCDMLYCEECRNTPEPAAYLKPVSVKNSEVPGKINQPPPRPNYSPRQNTQARKPKPERPKYPPATKRADQEGSRPCSTSTSPTPRNPPPPRPAEVPSLRPTLKLSKQTSSDLSVKPKRPERPPAFNQNKQTSTSTSTSTSSSSLNSICNDLNRSVDSVSTTSTSIRANNYQHTRILSNDCHPMKKSTQLVRPIVIPTSTGSNTIVIDNRCPTNNFNKSQSIRPIVIPTSTGSNTIVIDNRCPTNNFNKPQSIRPITIPTSSVSSKSPTTHHSHSSSQVIDLTSVKDIPSTTPHYNHVSSQMIYSNSDNELPCYQRQRSQSQTVEDIKQQEESSSMAIWYNIVDQYKSIGESFIDPEFPLSNKSLFLIPHKPISRYKVANWARPYDIKDVGSSGKWCVLNEPKTSDIAQGVLGNCWFLSALAVVAECPGIIEHIIITKQYCLEGVYQVRLCKDGQWCIYIIDDYFPVDSYDRLTFSKARRKQLWVPLIEKALAKMYGCYEALEGGQVIEGLQALTGYPCEKFQLRGDNEADFHDIDFEYIWTKLLSFKEARYPMAACTINDANMLQEFNKVGLKSNHAYSILDFKQKGTDRMVLLRDPWGYDDRGEGSNWFNSQKDGGKRWLGAWDFYKFFKDIDICHYIPDWHCFRTKISLPSYASSNQPVLHFHVFDETEVTINITQPSDRYSGLGCKKPCKDMSVMVLQLPPAGVHSSSESLPLPVECIAVSQSHCLPCVTCNVFLSPGRYAILPLSFKDWYCPQRQSHDQQPTSSSANCIMTVFSSKLLECEENVYTRPGFMRESLFLCAKKSGKSQEIGFDTKLLTLQIYPSLFIVMCENHNTTCHVNITCDSNGSTNVLSTRQTLKSIDLLPPKHKYKFNFETSMFTKWGAVYKPSLDKVNSELHQAYPITGSDSINIKNGRDRTRTVPVVDPFDCIVS